MLPHNAITVPGAYLQTIPAFENSNSALEYGPSDTNKS